MRPVEIPASATQRSVWDFPRPPALLPDGREVVITFAGRAVAETTRALTVLETSHPPTWYVPRDDIVSEALRPSAGKGSPGPSGW
jgi:uncharacterized protein (DUF427 family)